MKRYCPTLLFDFLLHDRYHTFEHPAQLLKQPGLKLASPGCLLTSADDVEISQPTSRFTLASGKMPSFMNVIKRRCAVSLHTFCARADCKVGTERGVLLDCYRKYPRKLHYINSTCRVPISQQDRFIRYGIRSAE